MLSQRSFVIAWASSRLLASDPSPMIITLIMPLLLMAFLMPSASAQLHAAGYMHATGAEQLVPGMAVMFAFLSTSLVVTLFYREYAWGTWDRLRASAASSLDLVVGKVVPLYLCLLGQMVVLFGAGTCLFGYRYNGSFLALAFVIVILVATLVTFGVMLVALFTTMDQAMVLGNLGGLVFSGLGGALAPASSLPSWAQWLAHGTPAYWALQALRDVTLNHAGLAQVALPSLLLLVFAVGFTSMAALRFRPTDAKLGTT